MRFEVTGEIIEWRGPAPFHFVVIPDAESEAIREVAGAVTYGWGVIPATCELAGTRFTTSLFPREGRYWIPLKVAARRPSGAGLGDVVTIGVHIDI